MTGLRGAQLRSRLESTADDLGAAGPDTKYGYGRLNSYRAVTSSTLDEGGSSGGGSGSGGTLAASFTYSCGGNATCDFDGSGSTGATSWGWAFGDGGAATGVTASHTYGSVDTFVVTLTVGDGTSTTSQAQSVTCSVRGKRLHCN